jgi:hypothetical protein
MSRLGMFAAVVVVVVAFSGCGVGAEQSADPPAVGTTSSELRVIPFNIPASSCRTVTLHPDAQGTVLSQLTGIGVAPVGTAVQSMYFNSTSTGPESRRGVAEFSVPALNGRITGAHLSFVDQHGFVLQAVPPDWHVLEVYGAADNSITASDFAREGEPFTTFSTDPNALAPQTHRVDLTGSVVAGQSLGIRIALERTPYNLSFAGSAFIDFRLDLTLCDEAALPGGSLAGRPGALR